MICDPFEDSMFAGKPQAGTSASHVSILLSLNDGSSAHR